MSPKTNKSTFAKRLGRLSCLLALAGSLPLHAAEVSTVPEGVFTVNITAAAPNNSVITLLSLPLTGVATAAGQMAGRLTGVTANSLTNANAGWTAGSLSTAATPYCIRITSGVAEGYTFLISTSTANTATTVTVDAEEAGQVNLTTLGLVTGVNGDTYEIITCDTIGSVFGTPQTTGILGGPTSTSADIVQMMVQGTWREYFYNTTLSRWARLGPGTASANVPIRPDTAIIYNRRGTTPLSITVAGRVPSSDRRAIVKSSGVTFLATNWPVDTTLLGSKIHLIPGWVTGTSYQTADIAQMFVSGTWREYYYNGTQWKRVGPGTVSDNVVIPAGTAVLLNRKGSATSVTALTQSLPYSL